MKHTEASAKVSDARRQENFDRSVLLVHEDQNFPTTQKMILLQRLQLKPARHLFFYANKGIPLPGGKYCQARQNCSYGKPAVILRGWDIAAAAALIFRR